MSADLFWICHPERRFLARRIPKVCRLPIAVVAGHSLKNPDLSDSRGTENPELTAEEVFRDSAVELYRVQQFLLGDEFALGMRYVDRSRSQQHRLAPVGEGRDVSGERSGHGGNAVHGPQFQKGNL